MRLLLVLVLALAAPLHAADPGAAHTITRASRTCEPQREVI